MVPEYEYCVICGKPLAAERQVIVLCPRVDVCLRPHEDTDRHLHGCAHRARLLLSKNKTGMLLQRVKRFGLLQGLRFGSPDNEPTTLLQFLSEASCSDGPGGCHTSSQLCEMAQRLLSEDQLPAQVKEYLTRELLGLEMWAVSAQLLD